MLAGTAGPGDAAPISKCRNNPENYQRYHGKCLSDKRIEKIEERRDHRGGDDHGHHGPNHK